jgi:hypothetical protein
MPRGQASPVGATRVADNGYHYTKTEERGWVLTHWLTVESARGTLIDPEKEVVQFTSKAAKRNPYDIGGIRVLKKKTSSLRKRLAVLEDQIREKTAERDRILRQLDQL